MVLSWLTAKVIGFLMAHTRAGDIGPTLRLDADDVTLVFPGQNSWSGTFRGKQEHGRWMKRLVAAGIRTYPDQVVAVGPPWNTTVCVRGHDHVDGPDGERVYDNRFVIWGRMSWGRLKHYEVYEDTHLANEFDHWLAEQRPELSTPVSS